MYLVTINRNISKEEFQKIIFNLEKKKVDYRIDPWNYKNILFVKKPKFFNGISQIIDLYDEFKVKTITDIVQKISEYKIKQINAKIKKHLNFHAKAIEDRFLRKNSFSKKGIVLYLEVKKRGSKVYCRFGKIVSSFDSSSKEKEISLLIENTTDSKEIADFLRLGVALKCNIFFKTNKNINKEITDAKKIFKSNKVKYNIISNLKEVKEYYLIGFSLWGKESEKALLNVKGKKILLLFGNEHRGLLNETLDACDMTVRLGPRSSEPLRANQAGAYAYGVLHTQIK